MKGYIVYSKIQQLKEKGFKKATVARTLCVNRRTVDHYWNMAPEVFEAEQSKICRQKMLANYQDIILKWMFEYSSLSAAQVCDWLKEHYQANFSERTVSRYVKDLRGAYNIKKQPEPRSYEAVPERPMGKQVQVDFGEKWIRNIHVQYPLTRKCSFCFAKCSCSCGTCSIESVAFKVMESFCSKN